MHRSKFAQRFVTLDRTGRGALSRRRRGRGRSDGRLRDAFDDLEIGCQRLALGFRPEQHGDHD